ncbi:hypothetical protein PIB30_062849 [Stylosanthes scabra]|uniref:Succinate dehydrogenase assembly factor 4, mitochondrial n=1 Tax=Stylosanthes scabra TaxID=79078 RepID=A0ABU6XMQ5_9FABA|nr:hypothetical protein [Stylosanthes scabra]
MGFPHSSSVFLPRAAGAVLSFLPSIPFRGLPPSLPPTSPKSVLGPSRTKPMKNEVIDLVSDEEKEVAEDKKDLEPEDEEEEEDPEEASASLTLPSPPKGPSGAYEDPHYWDYDGDLDQ